MKNIILAGFMGTGKTEIGRRLAKIFGVDFIDVDIEIEKAQGISISEIFEKFGESYFRDIESDMIQSVSKRKNIVVSTGGGAVLREENINNLKTNGIIICLWASPETILSRVKNNDERPLLKVADPLGKIIELLEFRKPYYEKADIHIRTDGLTPDEIVERILREIKWKE